ncbi:MAG TPA: type II and III secretion system protein family protein [Roseiarcus sp.]|nr:type II and III secretion system protein family protein [Roseiarcus sp.]
MKRRIIGLIPSFVGIAVATVALGSTTAFAAGPQDTNFVQVTSPSPVARRLQMGVGKSVIVDLPADASEIFVGDPTVANAIVRSARRLYIAAIANGATTIFAMDKDGRQIAVLEVSIGRDVAELKEVLNAAIPGNDIIVRTVADSIILTGSVASAGEAQKAVDIANGFVGASSVPNSGSSTRNSTSSSTGNASAGSTTSTTSISSAAPEQVRDGKVINSLIIRGLDQVSLRVTVAEIRREIVKQLGVNLFGQNSSGSSFEVQNPFAVNGALTATNALLNWTKGGSTLQAQLQAYERQGVAKTLAEPTVTAISGESAKFLAGGTIPIANGLSCTTATVITASQCLLSILQQPYGVSLNFTPVVLAPGRIQLRIATEVTDIDYSKQITLSESGTNVAVPGFRTRKNETTVELPSGGSIASAGLISSETQQAINGVPGLMNLPILGALFRSRDFLSNETELLIVVTPYIVHAVDPGQIVKPEDNFNESTDPQAWLLGRVNRLYSTAGAPQSLQNYTGKVGFIND